ncbi:hypothetical protein E5329_22785 [Petralouisia muris]|uniref:Uncharacterized protein n=1 Tax=Petralouisia muris TaxID=3032872 RepID=A0AC61RQJ9_9FIRM|nr:hypothetical protein [Petralouisia muris]TGY91114.1 hypothetical protein E5329_22785 [Petralouisia muris]
MTDKRDNQWVQRIEKRIEEKYPLCDIEWFYDKFNLDDFSEHKSKIEEQIMEIMDILCSNEKKYHFYIRVHKYKNWYVLRILVEKNISEELIDKIEGKLRKHKSSIIEIVYEKQCTIIKLTLS